MLCCVLCIGVLCAVCPTTLFQSVFAFFGRSKQTMRSVLDPCCTLPASAHRKCALTLTSLPLVGASEAKELRNQSKTQAKHDVAYLDTERSENVTGERLTRGARNAACLSACKHTPRRRKGPNIQRAENNTAKHKHPETNRKIPRRGTPTPPKTETIHNHHGVARTPSKS